MFNVDNSKDKPILIKPRNLYLLLFTKVYPRSHAIEKHLSSLNAKYIKALV